MPRHFIIEALRRKLHPGAFQSIFSYTTEMLEALARYYKAV